MSNPIVKYTQAEYRAKIVELESCLQRLRSHHDRLEDLKSQVPNFWNDTQTPEYLGQLTTAIIGVRNAMDNTERLLGRYNGMVEEMEGVTAMTTGLIEDISSVISGLGIVK